MYVCRKLRLCTYLLKHGFEYVREAEDRDNPKYKIWLFVNTPELHIAIEDYYSSDEFLNR